MIFIIIFCLFQDTEGYAFVTVDDAYFAKEASENCRKFVESTVFVSESLIYLFLSLVVEAVL